MNANPPDYAVRLQIDRQDPLDRGSTALRIFLMIPIAIVLGLLAGGAASSSSWEGGAGAGLAAGGTVFLPALLMIVFRQKYPRWWFDWNVQLASFSTRVLAYVALLGDKYPATDDEQSVHLAIDYPDAERDLNRWLPLVKWLLAIPHYFVLIFLTIGAFFAVVFAWFAILFTGTYPEGLFKFVVGVLRWSLRVQGYAFLLVTDRYPPFSLD